MVVWVEGGDTGEDGVTHLSARSSGERDAGSRVSCWKMSGECVVTGVC